MATPRILVFAGSIRRESFNRRLAKLAADAARAAGAEVTHIELADYPLPLMNEDLQVEQGVPKEAQALKKLFIEHDGLILSCPEYNSGITPLLKNVIDWGTRPYGTSVWLDKPGATIGTSQGTVGTAAAQSHLRSVLASLGVALMGRPEAYIVFKENAMDEAGNVADEATAKVLTAYVDALVKWLARLGVVQK